MFTERVQLRVRQREQTRQRVLESTDRLFREHGFGATTIRQIAADAGVSIGTVMAIGDKDGLLVAVFDNWIGDVHRDRKSAKPARSRAGAVPAIAGLFVPFLQYFDQDHALSREYAAIIVRGTHRSRIFDDLALALVSEIESALLTVGLPAGEAASRARTIYFAYLGIVMAGTNHAAAGQSTLETLRDAIGHLIPPTAEGAQR